MPTALFPQYIHSSYDLSMSVLPFTEPIPHDTRWGRGGGRALVLVAIVLYAFSLRATVSSITPLLGRIAGDLGFGSGGIGLIGTLPTVMFGIAGIVAPALGRRLGYERLSLVALALIGAGTTARSFADGIAPLLALTGVALLGIGFGNALLPPLVKRYFGDRIVVVSTVYITFVQLSTVIPAAVAVPVADAVGWRAGLAMWAAVPFAALLPWIAVLRRNRPAGRHGTGAGAPPTPAAPRRLPVWRLRYTWGLTLMFAMTSLLAYALTTWIPAIYTSAGSSEAFGGAMVAIYSLGGFAGTLLTPMLTTRLANPFPLAAFFCICALVGLGGLLWAPLTVPWLWPAIAGLGPNIFPMAITLTNLRTRTSEGSAALSGFAQGIGYLIASSGPVVVGLLYGATHSWGAAVAFLAGAAALMMCGSWVACRPGLVEERLA